MDTHDHAEIDHELELERGRHAEIDHEQLDELRRGHGPIGEHVIDEFVAGRLTRRDFLRRASAVGIGLPIAGAIASACSSPTATGRGATKPARTTVSPAAKAGATIRAGMVVPAGEINPLTTDDQGGDETYEQVGEFLVFTDRYLNYKPWLATSWKPNADGTVWSFKIRQGVKFNDGKPMGVDDVVYSFKQQCDPKNGGNALSVFGGLLDPAGVVKVDDETVAFHLEAADGSFIDAVSEDNYNMIIVPDGYDFSDYQKQFVGTGHFMLKSFNPTVGATFVRNPYYWGTKALPSELQVTYYATEAAQTSALEAGDIDCNDGFSVSGSPQLLDGSYNIIATRQSEHRELSMRCDLHPFTSKYVRQAIAYTLDRPQIVKALFKGYAQIGNDSPFAPVFKSTVLPPAVPQRKQDLKKAKDLLAKGGVPRGFKTPFYTEINEEMPDYAQIIKSSAAKIGVDISLTIETTTKYYGDSVIGKSDWLDGEMSLVDYATRAVPNLYLEAPLQTIDAKTGQGAWNAARFNNSTYDKLSKQFVAAVDLSTQRKLAKEIELLLLDETPIIYGYFYNYLVATQKSCHGVMPGSGTSIYYWNCYLS